MRAWIYFARFGTEGPIKIGRAVNPYSRVQGLMVGSPVVLHLLGGVRSDRAEKEEVEFHERLQMHCVRGEWFEAKATLREMQALGDRWVPAEQLLPRSKSKRHSRRIRGPLRNHQLTARIPQRIRDALEAEAKAKGCTIADICNMALTEAYPAPARKDRRRR